MGVGKVRATLEAVANDHPMKDVRARQPLELLVQQLLVLMALHLYLGIGQEVALLLLLVHGVRRRG
jgi:hypothetical protein